MKNLGFEITEEEVDEPKSVETSNPKKSNIKRRHTVVKFAEDDNVIIDDLDEVDLRVKIFKENQRRASIKPFKRAYDLNVESMSEDDDDFLYQ
jgi:hypothetical protein